MRSAPYPGVATVSRSLAGSYGPDVVRPPGSHSCRPDPRPHDPGGQPVSADLGLGEDGHAVAPAERVGAPGEEERGDIGVQRPAGLDVAVVLDIDCVAEQGPPVTVVLDLVSGVEEVP